MLQTPKTAASLGTEPVETGAVRPKIAVLIPCYNEEIAIPKVVADFRQVLPDAAIYVCDNNSKDRTAEIAREAGAIVLTERLKGKGNAIRRLFAEVDADIYLLVDGDDTYDAKAAPALINLMQDQSLDMVTGTRQGGGEGAYRKGHRFGNLMLTGVVRQLFGARTSDMLSGYRAFSRRFVKSFPALATGFETETEFTVHALALRLPVGEVPTAYGERPEGSVSKLNTYRDGIRILCTIVLLVKEEKPMLLFGTAAAALGLLGISLGIPVVAEFADTGQVPRLPTALLATGLTVLGCLSLVCGLVLDSVARGRKEIKRIAYLAAGRAG